MALRIESLIHYTHLSALMIAHCQQTAPNRTGNTTHDVTSYYTPFMKPNQPISGSFVTLPTNHCHGFENRARVTLFFIFFLTRGVCFWQRAHTFSAKPPIAPAIFEAWVPYRLRKRICVIYNEL